MINVQIEIPGQCVNTEQLRKLAHAVEAIFGKPPCGVAVQLVPGECTVTQGK